MTPNEQLIHTFYTAFEQRDYKVMQDCYSDNATFNDPVFCNLDSHQVRAMWEMFLVKNKSLTVDFSDIQENGDIVSARWRADYIFTSTGRSVSNSIKAEFRIENGKIVQHTDRFDFYRWAQQALGLKGVLLGWTPILKKKVQRFAMATLQSYIRNQK